MIDGAWPARYEVTIAGALGPVVRLALRPYAATGSMACTVVRLRTSDTSDLDGLLRILDRAGVEVDSLAAITRQERRDASAPHPVRMMRPAPTSTSVGTPPPTERGRS